MSVAAYLRVSSSSQDPAAQRRPIELAARARGERIDTWFADVASGRSLDRPELARLRRAVDNGAVRRLWIWRLDRLGRSGIADTLRLLSELRAAGCEVSSVTDPFPLDGPASEPIIAMLAWCAEMQRRQGRENQAIGIARMRLEGRRGGRPEALDTTQRAKALELCAAGWSCRRIARALHVSKSLVWNITRQSIAAA